MSISEFTNAIRSLDNETAYNNLCTMQKKGKKKVVVGKHLSVRFTSKKALNELNELLATAEKSDTKNKRSLKQKAVEKFIHEFKKEHVVLEIKKTTGERIALVSHKVKAKLDKVGHKKKYASIQVLSSQEFKTLLKDVHALLKTDTAKQEEFREEEAVAVQTEDPPKLLSATTLLTEKAESQTETRDYRVVTDTKKRKTAIREEEKTVKSKKRKLEKEARLIEKQDTVRRIEQTRQERRLEH